MPFEFHRSTASRLTGLGGVGKSTLFLKRVAHLFSTPCINADPTKQDELTYPRVEASLKDAQIASERRSEFLFQPNSFSTESVFSPLRNLILFIRQEVQGSEFWFSVSEQKVLTSLLIAYRAEYNPGGGPIMSLTITW